MTTTSTTNDDTPGWLCILCVFFCFHLHSSVLSLLIGQIFVCTHDRHESTIHLPPPNQPPKRLAGRKLLCTIKIVFGLNLNSNSSETRNAPPNKYRSDQMNVDVDVDVFVNACLCIATWWWCFIPTIISLIIACDPLIWSLLSLYTVVTKGLALWPKRVSICVHRYFFFVRSVAPAVVSQWCTTRRKPSRLNAICVYGLKYKYWVGRCRWLETSRNLAYVLHFGKHKRNHVYGNEGILMQWRCELWWYCFSYGIVGGGMATK